MTHKLIEKGDTLMKLKNCVPEVAKIFKKIQVPADLNQPTC